MGGDDDPDGSGAGSDAEPDDLLDETEARIKQLEEAAREAREELTDRIDRLEADAEVREERIDHLQRRLSRAEQSIEQLEERLDGIDD